MPPIDSRPKRARPKKQRTPAPRTDIQTSGKPGSYNTKRKAPKAPASKNVMRPTKTSPVFGPLKRADRPIRQARKRATEDVDRAIKNLPKAQRPAARAENKRQRQETTRDVNARQAVRDAMAQAKGDFSRAPNKADLAEAVRRGYGKVAGGHGPFQRKVTIERSSTGDFELKMDRRVLPDVHQLVRTRDIKPKDTFKRQRNLSDISKAETPASSAATRVLEVAGRPSHAVASVAAGKGAKGALEALKGKDKTTFGKILRDKGAPAAVAAVGGFALDVATDPTTYVTGGAGKAAQLSAKAAAKKATKEALERGASKKTADRAGRAAAKKTLAEKGDRRGVSVGIRANVPFTDKGIDIKTSGRASSALAHKTGVAKAAKKVRASKAGQAVGRTFEPGFRPVERTTGQHRQIRGAEREHRARVNTERQAIRRRMKALGRAVAKKDQERLIDAIEANRVDGLPEPLRTTARTIRRDLDESHAKSATRGIEIGKFQSRSPDDAQQYLPHVVARHVDKKAKKHAGSGGRTRVAASKGREVRKPLAALRQEKPGEYIEDLPKMVGTKLQRDSERRSLHDFWQRVAKTGRPLSRKETIADDEMVYKVEPDGLTALAKHEGRELDKDKVAKALNDRQGRYVILNQRTFEDVRDRLRGNQATNIEAARGYDKVQGALKKAFTLPWPSYHLRNLIGDSINAFAGDATARSFVQSGRALKARAQRNMAESNAKQFTEGGTTVKALDRTINLGKSGKTTLGAELKAAEKHGAIGQGFIGRELEDLTTRKGRVSDALQYREDLPRLATYLAARKRGMNPREAAEWSQKHHFDYGDLTPAEAKFFRRAIPFWTFFARNTKLWTTKIVTRPGKIATVSKILEEAALFAGFDSYEEYLAGLKDYEQRGLPLPVPWGGKVYDVQFAPPLTDLNQATLNPQEQIQNLANRVTFFKNIVELGVNYSVFFQGTIAPEGDELTRAPDLVGELPGLIKKKLGVQKVGGEWMWDRRADYAMRSLPGGNFALQQMLPERGTRNQTAAQARLGMLTGLKSTPHDSLAKRYGRVAEELHDATVEAERMRKRLQAADKDGFQRPEYAALLKKIRELTKQRDALAAQAGVKKPGEIKRRPPTEQEKLLDKLNRVSDPARAQAELLDKLAKLQGGG